jgi:hypothetical protein
MAITIFPNRRRFPIILSFCAVMSTLLIWSFFGAANETTQRNFGTNIFEAVCLTFALTATTVAAINYFYLTRNPNAKLVMDEEGIDDRLTIYSVGFVPWSNISGAEMKTFLGIDVLVIKLKDPESVVALQPRWKRRRLRRATRKFGTPMIVSQYVIDYDIKDLTRQIKMRLGD